jgi:hypothetical protein
MPGPLLRRQNSGRRPRNGYPGGCPHLSGPAPPPVARCIREIPPAMSSDQRASAAAIGCSACCSRGGAAMHTSPRRTVIIVAAVIAVGAATAALPATAEAGWHGGWGRVRLGLRDRIRCALLRRLLWQPVLRLRATVRLCHAPPLGDQSLRSSRLAVDSRLLLEAPFAVLGRPPARGASVACQPSGVT